LSAGKARNRLTLPLQFPGSQHRRLAIGLATVVLLALGAAFAFGEVTQRGDLFVRFDGGISPLALPRKSLAPIAVRIEGTVRVPAGRRPPAVRRIRIALNRGGRLSTRGLPVCHRRQIDPATPSEALAVCGDALVGAGGLVAKTAFPEQANSILRGEILLFNGVEHGRPAILAHVFQSDPAPIAHIVVFHVRRTAGTFGTVITGQLPPALNRNGYLKSIFLQLERRYAFRGHPRSYLSASCSAPPGFAGATFTFARASMSFDDGRTLSSTLIRSCRVSR